MKAWTASLGILLASCWINGCASYQVYTQEAPNLMNKPESFTRESLDYRNDADFTTRTHYFLWGLVGNHELKVSEACHGKAMQAVFVNKPRIENTVATILTLGLWLPRNVEVWCER